MADRGYSTLMVCERCGGRVDLKTMVPLSNDGRLMTWHMACENRHAFHFNNATADNKLAPVPGTGTWPCSCIS